MNIKDISENDEYYFIILDDASIYCQGKDNKTDVAVSQEGKIIIALCNKILYPITDCIGKEL